MEDRDIVISNQEIKGEARYLSMRLEEDVESYKINEETKKKIVNALNKGKIDSEGRLIFPKESLPTLLQTKKQSIEVLMANLKTEDIIKIKNKEFIEATELYKQILARKRTRKVNKQNIEAIGNIVNKMANDIVVEYYSIIRDEKIKESLMKLKGERIQRKGIKADELTGKKLKNAEFHHIRAKGIPGNEQYQLDSELGLIINKSTHTGITRRNIIDEEGLLEYCTKKKYDIGWYKPFKERLEKYKQKNNKNF